MNRLTFTRALFSPMGRCMERLLTIGERLPWRAGFKKIKSNVSVNRKQTQIIFFSSNEAAISYVFKAADPVGLYNFFFFVTCSPSMRDTNGSFVSMGSHMYFYKDLSAALK